MSRLISFALADLSCLPREESKNYKMKKSWPQQDSNPPCLAYSTGALTYWAISDLAVDMAGIAGSNPAVGKHFKVS